MATGTAARRYAKALHAIAVENDLLDRIEEELKFLADTIEEQKDFREVFFHPHILESEKKELAKNIFSGKLTDYTLNFLFYLVDKSRERELQAIYHEYVQLANLTRNLIMAEVVTAVPITETEVGRISDKLAAMTGKQIRVSTMVDETIVGGVIIRLGDKVMDGSIRRHLERMHAQLKDIQVREIGVSN